MRLVAAILFQLVVVNSDFSVCPDDYCDEVSCPVINCEGGRVVKNPINCGCCDVCIHPLDAGEACMKIYLSTLPRKECGSGLTCSENNLCEKADKKCVIDQVKYEESAFADLTAGKLRPQCDIFGEYASMQCKESMICYCVDPDGNRIFGTAPYSERKNMNCKCSRDYLKFSKGSTLIDKFPRCEENGNYDHLQCTEEFCFCLGYTLPVRNSATHRNGSLVNLRCWNKERHHPDMLTPCWRELKNITAQVEHYREMEETVIGVDFPKCDPDGSYAPIQCKDNKCFCVDKHGVPYRRRSILEESFYEAERYSKEAIHMTCRCVRDKEDIRRNTGDDLMSEVFGRYICASNGNYLKIQCLSSSSCFCVDETTGYQTSEPVLLSDRQSLRCYHPDLEALIGGKD